MLISAKASEAPVPEGELCPQEEEREVWARLRGDAETEAADALAGQTKIPRERADKETETADTICTEARSER